LELYPEKALMNKHLVNFLKKGAKKMSHPNTTFPMEYIIIAVVVAFIGFQVYNTYKLWTEKKVETKKLFNKDKKNVFVIYKN